MNSLLVIKFGGTSVGTPKAVRRAAQHVADAGGRPVLVVVSALSGVTDRLSGLGRHIQNGDHEALFEDLGWIYRRHVQQAGALLPPVPLTAYLNHLEQAHTDLSRQVNDLAMAKTFTAAHRDTVLSFGEWASARLFRLLLLEQGVAATFCEARELLVTNDHFGCSRPRLGLTRARLHEVLTPLLSAGRTVVTQGFVGATADGRTTTLGRGGSDYTATLFAALLEAQAVHIRTDVDGVFSADPNLIPEARHVARLNLEEAWELANYGAKVLYPPCLEPLRGGQVPLYVRNTLAPDTGGTLIGPAIRPDAGRIFVSLQKDGTLIRLRPRTARGSLGNELHLAAQQHCERLEAMSFLPEEITLVCGGSPNAFIAVLDDRVELVAQTPVALIHVFGGDPAAKPQIRLTCEALLVAEGAPPLFVGNIGPKQHFLFAVPLEDSLAAARLLHAHFHEHHDHQAARLTMPVTTHLQEVHP